METTVEIPKKSRYKLGANYTMPGSPDNFKFFFVDKKNAKAVYTKYTSFAAKRDLEMGLITEAEYRDIMKSLFGKRGK